MQELITSIKKALQSETSLAQHLNENTSYVWQENYPIAIVHEHTRVKEPEILAKLQELYLFGDDGFSTDKYTPKMIELLKTHAPKYIKTASLLCHNGEEEHAYSFQEKFPHDKWKKVLNTQDFKATVEISSFDTTASIMEIETELRDFMRSRKEIPALKPIAFIWIATVNKDTDITNIMQHYFGENYETLIGEDTNTYIGWNDSLKNINMRYFVVTPK